jgi:hypothetical protein
MNGLDSWQSKSLLCNRSWNNNRENSLTLISLISLWAIFKSKKRIKGVCQKSHHPFKKMLFLINFKRPFLSFLVKYGSVNGLAKILIDKQEPQILGGQASQSCRILAYKHRTHQMLIQHCLGHNNDRNSRCTIHPSRRSVNQRTKNPFPQKDCSRFLLLHLFFSN